MKKFHKKSSHTADIGKHRDHLLNVFQKHYDDLVTMIQSCPHVITNKLFTRRIVSAETLNQVITGQESTLKKASILLCDVRNHLTVNPEKLIEFVDLLKQERSLDFLTEKMMGK